MTAPAAHPLLPHAVPASPELQLLLYGIRRMAVGGVGDAYAAHAFLTGCGLRYRRPLVLLRALVVEIARTGVAKLAIGPCCCPRMSASERAMLHAIALAATAPAAAHELLSQLLLAPNCSTALDSATALANCFVDLGRPLAPGPAGEP